MKKRLNIEEANNFLSEVPFYLVTNREPYEHNWKGRGRSRHIEECQTIGGLSTALDSIMKETGGVWVASATGSADKSYTDKKHDREKNTIIVPGGYELTRVFSQKDDFNDFYNGFANRTLWPLFHEIDVPPVFHRNDYWKAYKKINRLFAERIPKEEKPFLWIHDYHLALLPEMIREEIPDATISFFWHIPWPSPNKYDRLPQRRQIINGLLGNDLIGFHRDEYCGFFLENARRHSDAEVNLDNGRIIKDGREILVDAYPISIDFDKFDSMAREPAIDPKELHTGKYVIFSAGRFDYTKGSLEEIRGIERFLEKYHGDYEGNFVFVKVAAPSRTKVREYMEHKKEVLEMIGSVNDRYRIGKWKPIQLIDRSLSQKELAEWNNRADAYLVLPHHDGMNLMAKEFFASQVDKRGVLVLSEFAGAAEELGDYSTIVNPFDKEGVADSINSALKMPKEEKIRRVRRARKQVKKHDIWHWMGSIISDSAEIYRSR